MKVVSRTPQGERPAVVADIYGYRYVDEQGRQCSCEPLPYCLIPWGAGRTHAEAMELAEVIRQLLEKRVRGDER